MKIRCVETGRVLCDAPIALTGDEGVDKRNAFAWGLDQDLEMQGADLRRADFTDFDFRAGRETDWDLDLRYCNFSGATLSGADMRYALLTGTRFVGSDLADADLEGVCASGVSFEGADLLSSNLRGADLSDSKLIGCDMRWSILIDSNLSGAVLTGADIRGAAIQNGAALRPIKESVVKLLNGAERAAHDILRDRWIAGVPMDRDLLSTLSGAGCWHRTRRAMAFLAALIDRDADAINPENNGFSALLYEWIGEWIASELSNASGLESLPCQRTEERYEHAA